MEAVLKQAQRADDDDLEEFKVQGKMRHFLKFKVDWPPGATVRARQELADPKMWVRDWDQKKMSATEQDVQFVKSHMK